MNQLGISNTDVALQFSPDQGAAEPLMDEESGEKLFHILSITWTFATSFFFKDFDY